MAAKIVLVVEDDMINRRLIKKILQPLQCTVIEAENAEDGIALAREQVPDLILMDIVMPGMDGWTAVTILKENPALRDIPIYALSGYSADELEEKVKETGCTGFITKPFNIQTFRELVSQHL